MMNKKANVYFVAAVMLSLGCKAKLIEEVTGPQAVRVTAARQGSIVEGRDYLGEVVSVREIKVLAQVPGSITALPFEEGAVVTGGDEVARIAAPEISARLARVRAERGRTEKERDFLCNRVKADRALTAAGDLPVDKLDMGEKNCRSSRLAVKAAKAAEREAGVFTARATERAPFDGILLDRMVEVGQTVGPGAPLMVLGSTARELSVLIPQDDMNAAVKVGATVQIGAYAGKIRRLGTRAKGPGRTVELRITPDPAMKMPAIGAIHRLQLVIRAEENATMVRLQAVGHDAKGAFLLLVDGEKARRMDVKLGPQSDGWVAVSPAPVEGAKIVTGGVERIDLSASVMAVEVQP